MCANTQTQVFSRDTVIRRTIVSRTNEISFRAIEGGQTPARILVVNDVEETRDALEKLLTSDGYRVDAARGEEDAVLRAKRDLPALILVSLGGPEVGWIASAARIRNGAELGASLPIVLFGAEGIPEGAEVQIDTNIYLTSPDNFDQLRRFLRRLLDRAASV
jgi:DNA-binding response OmpR family regulator